MIPRYKQPTHVEFTGPHPRQDKHGDEVPTWDISIFNDEDLMKTHTRHNFRQCRQLAEKIASAYGGIEIIYEAFPA